MSSRRKWLIGGAVALTLLVIWNAVITVPVALARQDEKGVSMLAYRKWLVSPSTMVLDLRNIEGTNSMADVDRNVFKSAEALKGHQFETVELAYRGTGRFLVDGAKFNEIGEQWRTQSVAYLLKALSEDAANMDGTPAFGSWSGGWLGVMMRQLQDHNQLHWQWYLASELGADPNSPMPETSSSADEF